MPTFTRNRRRGRGFTLVEMLVALAILSIASLIAASAINAHSPRLMVDSAANALVIDLKRARLEAGMRGAPIEIQGAANGYRSSKIGLDQSFPRGVTALWNGKTAGILVISSGLRQKGGEVVIEKAGASARIDVEAFTGRISRVR